VNFKSKKKKKEGPGVGHQTSGGVVKKGDVGQSFRRGKGAVTQNIKGGPTSTKLFPATQGTLPEGGLERSPGGY